MTTHKITDLLRQTLDGLPANIAIVGQNGQIILVNHAWRDFAKKNGASADAVSESVNYLKICDKASGDYSKEAKSFAMGIRKILSGEKKAFQGGYPCHSPRQKRWFIGSVAPFPADENCQAIVAHVNITKLKKTEHKLKELNTTLEWQVAERTKIAELRSKQLQYIAVELIESEERERRRIAGLLHDDLQQVLIGARLLLDSVYEKLQDAAELSEVRRLIDDSIGKLRGLSHELSPALLYHSGLGPALELLCEQMRERFGLEVNLEIEPKIDIESLPIRVFLFRAVQELLLNIIKHAGVKKGSVEFHGVDNRLIISVSEMGRGFDPSIELNVYKGGLGLMSIRERARYIGGDLLIQSAPGRGSKLSLTIPTTGFAEPIPSVTAQGRVAVGEKLPNGGEIRVLFADDHKVIRQGLVRLITGKPNISIVGEASNGREALELARKLKPEVVIMDVSMPEMDGVEATRHIKSEMPDMRVIGLSMHDAEHISQTMMNAGAEAYISKTASLAELLKAIYGNK
jgi:signal transduction histidine kinase/CheY-like chemotaxis protein